MQLNLQSVSSEYLTQSLLPSIVADQLFNISFIGLFLLSRKRILQKTYSTNRINNLGRLLLRYQNRTQIKSGTDYLQKTGKYALLSILTTSIIKTSQKAIDLSDSIKIQDFIKPIILFTVFKLNLGIGAAFGLLNLSTKYVLDRELKQFF